MKANLKLKLKLILSINSGAKRKYRPYLIPMLGFDLTLSSL
jgi:hypothetical protein